MEVSPGNIPLPQPRHALKRSASTASLPTPPRTHRRHKRGRSRGDCDSESDNDETLGVQGSALLSSDEEGDELPYPGQNLRKKRRLSQNKGADGDEEAFWLAGPDPESHRQEESDRGYVDKEKNIQNDDSSTSAPLLYRKSLRRSQSQGSNGLVSPPPSHRKPQTQGPITPPAGATGPSTSITSFKTQPASPPKTPRKQTGLFRGRKGAKTPEFPAISDSPDNPFYVVPASPSPGEESESPRVDSVSPRTPGTIQHEKPTVTYVFRGVRREYHNPLYDHVNNRPLSPPPTSLLPIEHPDFSPDMGCKPTVLFPHARKGKRPATTKREGSDGASVAVRRSPRRKKATTGDGGDEGGLEDRAVNEEDEEALIRPRKLDFGLPKNAMGKAKIAPSKAKTVRAGDDLF